jgi:hypothetical protein
VKKKERVYEYIIIRIGDVYYSTDSKIRKRMKATPSMFAREKQKGEYVHSVFVEKNGHKKISPVPFELDLYWHDS